MLSRKKGDAERPSDTSQEGRSCSDIVRARAGAGREVREEESRNRWSRGPGRDEVGRDSVLGETGRAGRALRRKEASGQHEA